jgi:hypothetical protein
MRVAHTVAAGVVGLCLAGAPLLCIANSRPGPPRPGRAITPAPAGADGSSSEAARRAAIRCWAGAQTRVNREREAVEAWDPHGADRLGPEDWRRQLMARDEGGDLRRARSLARQSITLAWTSAERYAAVPLGAHLAYDAGDAAAPAGAVPRLVAMRPHGRETLVAVWRAGRQRQCGAHRASTSPACFSKLRRE